jgi:hypothetical protein
MFSFIVVCILAIWAFICSGFALVSAGVVAAGVAVTVAAGVAVTVGVAVTGGVGAGVTGGVGAGVAVGSGIGAGVTVGVGAGVAVGSGIGAGVTVGVGAGVVVGAGFWARAGIHIRESATIDTRTGLGTFMGVLLDGALDGWRRVPTGSSESEGARVGLVSSRKRCPGGMRPQHSAQCSTLR